MSRHCKEVSKHVTLKTLLDIRGNQYRSKDNMQDYCQLSIDSLIWLQQTNKDNLNNENLLKQYEAYNEII